MEPHSHSQIWRIPLSIFYHHGIIHVLLVAIAQLYLGSDLEKIVGWLRIGVIYIISGEYKVTSMVSQMLV